MDAARYAVTERLRNGAALHIRAVRPADRDEMLATIGRSSARTLYRRFFGPKRNFSEREIDFFLNVDFHGLLPCGSSPCGGLATTVTGGSSLSLP